MLSITPISFSGIRNLANTKTKAATLPKMQNDTFVRSNTINFKGCEKCNEFSKWCNETGFKPENIDEIINNPELEIGKGNQHTAFNIPNCKDFVIRVSSCHVGNTSSADWKHAKFVDAQDKNLNVNIGQPVAFLEVPDTHAPIYVEILKKQAGEPIGNKPAETLLIGETEILKAGEAPYEDMSRKEQYARTIQKVADLPISAYEELIDTYIEASKLGYTLDHLNSNNILVDSENQKLNLIDMSKGQSKEKFDGLLYALLNAEYFDTYTADYPNPVSNEEKMTALKNNVKIIQNFTQAMKNKGVKFNRDEICIEFFNDVIRKVTSSFAFGTSDTEEKFVKMRELGILE